MGRSGLSREKRIARCRFRIKGAATILANCQATIIKAKYRARIIASLEDSVEKYVMAEIVNERIRNARKTLFATEDILVEVIQKLDKYQPE